MPLPATNVANVVVAIIAIEEVVEAVPVQGHVFCGYKLQTQGQSIVAQHVAVQSPQNTIG
jgi:hypothetical protein